LFTKKQTHVICPFCCHKFHPNEADFRLINGTKTTDENLFNYNLDILQNEKPDAKANAYQAPWVTLDTDGVTYDESDIEKCGFIQRVNFKNSNKKQETSEQRLCPNCHNNLPTGYGMRDTVLISILGDARSGKSVFLTVLLSELEDNPDFISKLTYIGDKQVHENFYETYHKPLFKENTLISSTKRKKVPPYAFNYWYQYKDEDGNFQDNTIDIIFYDIAGEDLRDDDGIRHNGFNIKDSSGLIFLIDPTNFTKLSDLFRFTDSALIEAIPEDNSTQAIFDTLYNYFIGLDREKSTIPLALALSKADLLKHVNFDFFKNKPESRIQHTLTDEVHRGAVNMSSIKGIHQEVREFISYMNEDKIINTAMACFKNVNYFAVSSLGKKPVVEKISDPDTNETVEKGFIDGHIEPFRVKEPFYWLLMRNQLMLKHENELYSPHGDTVEKTAVPIWQRLIERLTNFFAGRN